MNHEHDQNVLEVIDILVAVKHRNDLKVDVTGVYCQSKMKRRLASDVL